MSPRRIIASALVTASMGVMMLHSFPAKAEPEWLTWGHDPERTGSNPDETILNKDNVSRLDVKWVAQISTTPKDYTAEYPLSYP